MVEYINHCSDLVIDHIIIIENCPLSETILSLEEPAFQDFIFIGVSVIFLVVAEIDKEVIYLDLLMSN